MFLKYAMQIMPISSAEIILYSLLKSCLGKCKEITISDFVLSHGSCEQHSRLLERPPDLACKRGSILQKSPAVSIYCIFKLLLVLKVT